MSNIKPTSKAPFNTTHENMIRAVVAFALNTANLATTQLVTAFYNLILLLDTNITTVDNLRASIAQPITGYAAQKKAAKIALAAASANIMKATFTYATDNNLPVLASQMKVSQSQMLEMKYVDLVTFAQGAIAIVTPLATSLTDYGVTPLQLTNWNQLTTLLNSFVSNPKNEITGRKTINTDIQSLLRQSMLILANQCDELAFQFRPNNVSYYNNYLNNRRLYPGNLSTQLRIHVTDSNGNPVTTGEVFIIDTDRMAILDNKGYALVDHIPFVKDEKRTVSVTTPSGTESYGPYQFKKGKSLTLHVTLGVFDAKKKTTSKVTVTEEEIPVTAEK